MPRPKGTVKKANTSTEKTTTQETTTPKKENIVKELIEGSIVTKKDKYKVHVVFDGELEQDIRKAAAKKGVGVATYIKLLVKNDLLNN